MARYNALLCGGRALPRLQFEVFADVDSKCTVEVLTCISRYGRAWPAVRYCLGERE